MANGNNGNGAPKPVRCAIYTRKSTDEGLNQDFNSLDAQRDAGEAYIRSQAGEGWTLLSDQYDDGGYTGANMDRPALRRLLADIQAKKVDCVVVYKVDRLSRSDHPAQFCALCRQQDLHAPSSMSASIRRAVRESRIATVHRAAQPQVNGRAGETGEFGTESGIESTPLKCELGRGSSCVNSTPGAKHPRAGPRGFPPH
jgi:hypothetical protein